MLTWFIIVGIERYAGIDIAFADESTIAGFVGLAWAYFVPPSVQDIVKRIDKDVLGKV